MLNKSGTLLESSLKLDISNHTPNSFKSGYFQSAVKGQEFFIQADSRLTEWAKDIVQG